MYLLSQQCLKYALCFSFRWIRLPSRRGFHPLASIYFWSVEEHWIPYFIGMTPKSILNCISNISYMGGILQVKYICLIIISIKLEYQKPYNWRKLFVLHQYKVKLMTLVEGDPKALFSIATPRCRGASTPFFGLLHFILDPYLIMLSVKQGGYKYYFWVFGLNQPGIQSRSSGPLASTSEYLKPNYLYWIRIFETI